MRLASLRTGGRDGTLVVVDSALRRAVAVPDIAPTLRAAIEDWDRTCGPLAEVSAALEAGEKGMGTGAVALDPDELASPLPRAFQFLDGSVYLGHMEKARAARGAAMPTNYKTEPIMYQGGSDAFVGPHEPMHFPSAADEIDYEPELAVVVDDVPMGTSAKEAGAHIKLVMLLNDWTLRALTRHELPRGFGFLQAKPTSSFGPVAVTLDELGDCWDGERIGLRVVSAVNGRELGSAAAEADMFFTYPELIAHACRTRSLSAGTIIGAGAISNETADSGHGCIAEARIAEEREHGAPRTGFLTDGDVVRIEALNPAGDAVLGVIEQPVRCANV